MTSKMRMLEQGSYSAINEVVPYPDFSISFVSDNGRSVLVECPEERTPQQVIEYVNKSKGGSWMMGIWSGGENPHRNAFGLWVWLLVKG